jgi:hypothetical protein
MSDTGLERGVVRLAPPARPVAIGALSGTDLRLVTL